MKEKIDSFSGDNRFLSNFFIEPDGSCVEVEFQRAKCRNTEDAKGFDGLSPADAKKLGRKIAIRHDWEQVKFSVMSVLVLLKFYEHPSLTTMLLETGDAILVEGNHWHDTTWGVCDGVGDNWLGKILMFVRSVVRVPNVQSNSSSSV